MVIWRGINPLTLLTKPKILGLGNLGLIIVIKVKSKVQVIIGLFHNVCPITCLFYYHPSNGRLSQLYCGDSTAHFLI